MKFIKISELILQPNFLIKTPKIMMRFVNLILIFFPFLVNAQVVDFENLDNLNPGDPVGEITLEESDYSIQFYIGYDINDTVPLRIQKVAHNSLTGGFYGPESRLNCEGQIIKAERINQINDSKFSLNPELTNRERVGCHFISGILIGETLPSIFIFYNKPVMGCSADLLDVDGHDNTIEAYDIYCYRNAADYPLNPINNDPIEIRSIGQTFGQGILGDNGGVMPFNIDFIVGFTLIEIRPIQQVSGGNTVRNEFGFALDNYSPISVEQAPYIPPYMTGEQNNVAVAHNNESPTKILAIQETETTESTSNNRPFAVRNESIYFDFDSSDLTPAALEILDDVIDDINGSKGSQQKIEQIIYLSGFTDPKGDKNYNQNLSKKRVNAAAKYLIKHGVDASLIEKTYHGEDYSGDESDSDAKKRTVQITRNYRKV
ncbi:MAG: outer membrane protein OmpA-like peptidoglycan-associated protein [Crocinitomix sp.]|jgi:outer membrane protein OmpA-like peptidoglycan-associated protein